MTDLLWTFPLLMFASIVIGWAAELTAVHLSAGMALAILAWLQTAPEFAVEATIAWHQEADLALANLTGSLRLLLGFGWPVIFFIYWWCGKKKARAPSHALKLPEQFAVEAAGLAIPVVYFLVIVLKRTWTAVDGVILCSFYVFYFWLLNRERKFSVEVEKHEEGEEDDHENWLVKRVTTLSNPLQYLVMISLFVFGGGVLLITVHPFLESLKVAAFSLGISQFIFIQWIAPIASELPEKITAFNWARRPGKAPMAVVNMLSSVTSQWTLLAGLVPIIFSLSAGRLYTIEFNQFQVNELLLTVAQSAVAVAILADLRIHLAEMVGFFLLWIVQFFVPTSREPLIAIYSVWAVAEFARVGFQSREFLVLKRLKRLLVFR